MKKSLALAITFYLFTHTALADMNSANQALKAGDFAKAVEEFTKLAAQGNVKAQSHLGYMYYVGEGVPQNYTEAAKWYRKAAAQGDKDAQYNLAVSYAFGEGIKQDYKEAAIWYRRAAEQGHAIAQYSLGISYIYGEGVEQDEKQAAEWFLKSAEQGYERAQIHLGSMFHTGDGIPKNYDKAIYWYRKAADRGNAAAQYNLGTLYRAGKGVPQDYNQAMRWFRLAADQGYAAAQNELQSMERAIAGATRELSKPDIEPEPDTKPETKPASKTIASTDQQAAAPAQTSPDIEQTAESATPLVTLQKETLLQLDSGEGKTEDEEIIEQAPAPTTVKEIPQTTIAADKSKEGKPGFFSRLFGNSTDKETKAKEETRAAAYKDIATPYQPEEIETIAEKEVIEDSTSERAGTANSIPSNAITNLWARPLIKQPAIEDTETAIVSEPEKLEAAHKSLQEPAQVKEQAIAKKEPVEIKKVETPYAPPPQMEEEAITKAEPKQDVEKKPVEIKKIETPYDPSATPPKVEKETITKAESEKDVGQKPVEIKAIEKTYQPLPTEPIADVPLAETTAATEEKAETSGVFGFFSKLFSSDDQDKENIAAPDEVVDETIEANTATVTEAPLPPTIETPVVKSYAEGEAPAKQQLSAVKEKSIVMLDEDLAMQATSEPLDTPDWDKQLLESGEVAEETNKTNPAAKTNVVAEDASEDLFQHFGDFFSNDNKEEQTTEQNDVISETAIIEKGVNEPTVQAAVEAPPEPSIDKAAAEALETETHIDTSQATETAVEFSDMSFETLQSLAVKGDSNAQYELGRLYYAGKGTKQNYSLAFLWYRRAAQQGNMEAQYSLGNMYLMGEGISQNDTGAMQWYALAAEQGHTAAQHNLENLQRVADSTPTDSDPEGSQDDVDNTTEEKQGFLSKLFSSDNKKDTPVEQIPSSETTEQVAINEETNEEEAPVATAESDYKQGVAYSYGEGVVQNHDIAFQYFKKSAELGYAPAQYKLGVAYAYGEGVQQNIEQAIEWYKKAAEQGYAIAQRNLGNMYTKGDGIEKNKPLGLAWYSILAEQGNVMDVHRRDTLKKELSESEIEEAERLKQQLSLSIKTASSSS